MKKLKNIFLICVSAIFLCACVFSERVPNYEFVGKKTYFLESSQGTSNYVFALFNAKLLEENFCDEIQNVMSQKGYDRVFDESEADFKLSPVYTQWQVPIFRERMLEPYPESIYPDDAFHPNFRYYLDLALFAQKKDSSARNWSGYSFTKLTRRNFTLFTMKLQIREALEDFPVFLEKVEK